MRQEALISVLLLSLLACGTENAGGSGAGDAADALDFGVGGAADSAGFGVTEVGDTGRWEFDAAPLPPGAIATIDNLEGVAYAFRLRLETAASVAFVARATSGAADPYVVLKDSHNATLAIGRDQGFLPMAAERDAIVTFDAEAGSDYILIVADTDLASAGHFVVDVVVLSDPLGVDLGWTDAGARAMTQALRDREPELAALLTTGAVLEDIEGYVSVGDLTEVPLRDRAELNGLIANVTDLRAQVYEKYGEERHAEVGRAAAELYWAVRAP